LLTAGVLVKVTVGVSVKVGELVGVLVKVGVFVALGVCVGVSVNVGVEVAVKVAVGVSVAVLVAVGVRVTVNDGVIVAVTVRVFVKVGSGVHVSVTVEVADGVRVRVRVGVLVGVALGRVKVGIGVKPPPCARISCTTSLRPAASRMAKTHCSTSVQVKPMLMRRSASSRSRISTDEYSQSLLVAKISWTATSLGGSMSTASSELALVTKARRSTSGICPGARGTFAWT